LAVVEAEFCLLEVEMDGMFWDAVELDQAPFREAPEALDSLDAIRSVGEFVVGMLDPDSSASTCPWKGELRAQASAM